MRSTLIALCLFLPVSAFAACPKGTAETLNAAGVPNCISVTPPAAAAAKPAAPRQDCPAGSASYSQFFGDTVCKRLDTGKEFMNQGVGCPLGTFPTTDIGGNRICQKQ